MKSVLRSVKPYWIYLILIGKKKVEVGKNYPKSSEWNKVVEMYCSKDMKSFNRIPAEDREWMRKYLGKVACRFVCDRIEKLRYNCDGYGHEWHEWNDEYVDYANMCLSEKELEDYLGTGNGYGWHISDLKIYDTPKELREFSQYKEGIYTKRCIKWDDDCKFYDFEDNAQFCGLCMSRKNLCPLTRPPQSWCYVEEKSNE